MTTARQHPTTPLAHVDVVVLDYLAALWAAAEDLPPDLRDELMSTVADYIAMRRGARVDPLDDAEQIIRRLGPPEGLVAAAGRGRLPVHLRAPLVEPDTTIRPAGQGDHAAVVLLVAGAAVLPGISSLAGLLLMSGSGRWTSAQKAAAWVLTAGGGLLGLVCLVFFGLYGIGEAALVMTYLSLLAGSAVAGLTLVPGLTNRRV